MQTRKRRNPALFTDNTVEDGLPKKRNLNLSNDDIRKANIASLLRQYDFCTKSIADLKRKDTSTFSERELRSHNRALDIATKKKKILSDKITGLGVKMDRRGRPELNEADKYKTNHKRIGCYFTKSNARFLDELKASGKIKNISAFINQLIEEYLSVKGGGNCDRQE